MAPRDFLIMILSSSRFLNEGKIYFDIKLAGLIEPPSAMREPLAGIVTNTELGHPVARKASSRLKKMRPPKNKCEPTSPHATHWRVRLVRWQGVWHDVQHVALTPKWTRGGRLVVPL
jgi:hypothetical protein